MKKTKFKRIMAAAMVLCLLSAQTAFAGSPTTTTECSFIETEVVNSNFDSSKPIILSVEEDNINVTVNGYVHGEFSGDYPGGATGTTAAIIWDDYDNSTLRITGVDEAGYSIVQNDNTASGWHNGVYVGGNNSSVTVDGNIKVTQNGGSGSTEDFYVVQARNGSSVTAGNVECYATNAGNEMDFCGVDATSKGSITTKNVTVENAGTGYTTGVYTSDGTIKSDTVNVKNTNTETEYTYGVASTLYAEGAVASITSGDISVSAKNGYVYGVKTFSLTDNASSEAKVNGNVSVQNEVATKGGYDSAYGVLISSPDNFLKNTSVTITKDIAVENAGVGYTGGVYAEGGKVTAGAIDVKSTNAEGYWTYGINSSRYRNDVAMEITSKDVNVNAEDGDVSGVYVGTYANNGSAYIKVDGNVNVSNKNATADDPGSDADWAAGVYLWGVGNNLGNTVVDVTKNITVESATLGGTLGIYAEGGTVTAGNIDAKSTNENGTVTRGARVYLCSEGVAANITTGSINANAKYGIVHGTSIRFTNDNTSANVKVNGDITVSGTDVEATGISFDGGENKSGNASVLVNGNVTSSQTGIELLDSDGKINIVVTGTVDAAGTALYADNIDLSKTSITVYELKSASGELFGTGEEGNTEDLSKAVNYIIKNASEQGSFTLTAGAGGKVGAVTDSNNVTYQTATAAKDYKVTVATVPGYTFKSFAGNSASLLTANEDGSYTLIVPEGGGVSLEMVYEMIKQAEDNTPANTGSVGAAVTGTWTQNFKGEWFYCTNRQVRNSWAYIADPTGAKEGNWYRFGVSGAMLTGWQEIDGKWYYFNETPGADLGKLLVNTTTPDGKRVGADGALIQ